MNFFIKLVRKIFIRDVNKKKILWSIENGLKIGNNCKILQDVILDPSHVWHIEIGDDVTLSPRVHVLAHDASTKIHLGYTKIGKVKIGSRVFIGANSTILPGVTIGSDVIVGANSVVSKDIPEGTVFAGNPAKLFCTTEEFLERKKKEMQTVPCFDEKYTIELDVNNKLKKEMDEIMKDGIGYIR